MNSQDSSQPTRKAGRLGGFLRLAFGAVVLGLVAMTLPWSDELVFHTGQGEDAETLTVPGEILGDWTGDELSFRPDPDPALGSAWPVEVRRACAEGEVIVVRRSAPDPVSGASYDWRPSMPRTFRGLDPRGLAQAGGLLLIAMCCAVTRWWRLLALVGCRTSWLNALRLTFLGLFFNLVMPGLTGGDLIKSIMVAHENPGRRGEAVVSVVVDRLIGLVTLASLALVVILLQGEDFAEFRLPVVGFLAAVLLGAFVYVNRTLRELLRVDRLLSRLPLGDKLKTVDEAILTYGSKPFEILGAGLISLVNHCLVTLAFVSIGGAFGVTGVSVMDYFVVVPIGNILSALSPGPGGWGFGEAAFKFLFEMIQADGSLGVAVSVTFRICMLAFGLLGGIFLLLPGTRDELRRGE